MIDNHLYKVLKKLISLEEYYYQKIELTKAVNLLMKSKVKAKEIDSSLSMLEDEGYIKMPDSPSKRFIITPKAHAAIEEAKRTRLTFWIPVVISIVALLFSLLPIREILQTLIEAISQQ